MDSPALPAVNYNNNNRDFYDTGVSNAKTVHQCFAVNCRSIVRRSARKTEMEIMADREYYMNEVRSLLSGQLLSSSLECYQIHYNYLLMLRRIYVNTLCTLSDLFYIYTVCTFVRVLMQSLLTLSPPINA